MIGFNPSCRNVSRVHPRTGGWGVALLVLLAVCSEFRPVTADDPVKFLPAEPALHLETNRAVELYEGLGRQYERVRETAAWRELVRRLEQSNYRLAAEQLTQMDTWREQPLQAWLETVSHATLSFYRSPRQSLEPVLVFETDEQAAEVTEWIQKVLSAWEPNLEVKSLEASLCEIRIPREGRQADSWGFVATQAPYVIWSLNQELALKTGEMAAQASDSRGLSRNKRYQRVRQLHQEHDLRIFIDPSELKRVLGLPRPLMAMEGGEVAGVGAGFTLKDKDNESQWLTAAASFALTTPTSGVFRGLQMARPIEAPPIDPQQVTAMQGLSFRWQDLFEFADEAFAKVLGPDALRRIIDSEGAVIGTSYRDFRDFFASLSQSVYMGYVQAPETGYLGMFYAYQFSDEAAAEQFVQRQIGTGLDFKNFPLQKRRLHGHNVWVRDRQTLEQMYKSRRLPLPAGSPEQWATPLGLEAFVVVDRWVVQCDQPALTHLIAQAEIDQRLTDLDNDIRQVLRASGRTVKPFAFRWVKPQHWRTKYGLGTPLPAEDEQSESERSPRSSRAGAADRNRSRQEAADEPDPADSGINRVLETDIMEALNQLFYDEFGGHVIAGYTEESYLKLEIRAFKSDTQPQG